MKSTMSLVAAAAVAGLFAGAATVRAESVAVQGSTVRSAERTASSSTAIAGHRATNMDDTAGKHDCKGKNDCKGAGGCKSGDNGCKGKNSCKGKGGCSTNTTSKPAAL